MTIAKTIAVFGALSLFPCHSLAQKIEYKGCIVDAEVWKLPACALEKRKDGKLFVEQRYLAPFRFEKPYGYAWSSLPEGDLAYFDRGGEIRVRHVAMFDNGPGPFHHGLVRVEQSGKWGLANANGTLVVPLIYDGILEPSPPSNHWRVCRSCQTKPTGDYSYFDGGTWQDLDQRGRPISSALH
jgi:hypothetical protein